MAGLAHIHVKWSYIQGLSILPNFHSEPTQHREVVHKFAQTANNSCMIGLAISLITEWSLTKICHAKN